MGMNMKTTYHRDGTVTYWSVVRQCWRRRVCEVPYAELACMSPAERERVERHTAPGRGE